MLLGRIALLFPLRRALPARRLAALGARAALSTDCQASHQDALRFALLAPTPLDPALEPLLDSLLDSLLQPLPIQLSPHSFARSANVDIVSSSLFRILNSGTVPAGLTRFASTCVIHASKLPSRSASPTRRSQSASAAPSFSNIPWAFESGEIEVVGEVADESSQQVGEGVPVR